MELSLPTSSSELQTQKFLLEKTVSGLPQDRCKGASVNSFGIGGSNAHIILESPDSYIRVQKEVPNIDVANSLTQLLVFSANTQESLCQQFINNTRYLEQYPDRVFDMAYTLNQRREYHAYRTFCTVGNHGAMGEAATIAKIASTVPNLFMVLSGQGAQWPTMGKELLLTNLKFRRDIGAVDSILQSLQHSPTWHIEGESCLSPITHTSIL